MGLVVPHSAEQLFLSNVTGVAGNLIRLFSNNVTIVVGTLIGGLTEVTGGGYAAITLTAANWGYTQATPTVALYNAFTTFTFTGAPGVATVYGYYVTTAGGSLLWAENITVVNPINGTSISIKPRITMQSVQQ